MNKISASGVICILHAGSVVTETNERDGADSASPVDGSCLKIVHFGTTSRLPMVSARQQALHSKDRRIRAVPTAIPMSGKGCVGAAAIGLHWLVARRKEQLGLDMHTRFVLHSFVRVHESADGSWPIGSARANFLSVTHTLKSKTALNDVVKQTVCAVVRSHQPRRHRRLSQSKAIHRTAKLTRHSTRTRSRHRSHPQPRRKRYRRRINNNSTPGCRPRYRPASNRLQCSRSLQSRHRSI